MSNFLYASRLNSFKARPELFTWRYGPGDVRDLLRRASQVQGLDRIVLNYPEHFNNLPFKDMQGALAEVGLPMGDINLRYPEPEFLNGAFTNPDPATRRSAIRLTQDAVDMCRKLGSKHLALWMSHDGYDYPFQVNYARLWEWELEGIRAVADYAPELKISIEYKPADPRRFSLLSDLGVTLLAVSECQRSNLGVTLDFCHVLMAKENPATSAAHCLRLGRLFGLHLNDGYESLDDGLMIGSVNLIQTLELLTCLVNSDYQEAIYFDTFPVREDPVKECEANIHRTKQMVDFVSRLDQGRLRNLTACQDALGTSQLVWEALFQR